MKNAMEKVPVTWVCGIALLLAREILFRTLIWDDVTKICVLICSKIKEQTAVDFFLNHKTFSNS
jgi:hypothetical protein